MDIFILRKLIPTKCNLLSTIFIAALLPVLWFSSCIEENFVEDCGEIDTPVFSGEKETRYFSFNLDMVDGVPYTRAESSYGGENKGYSQDFEDGSSDESTISNLLIIFFDETGNYLYHFDSEEMQEGGNQDDEKPAVEELTWKKTITVPVETFESIKDNAFHSYFVIVNYDEELKRGLQGSNTSSGEVTYISRSDLLNKASTKFKITKESSSEESKVYFVMTTPGHFDSSGNYLYYGLLPNDKKTAEDLFPTSRKEAESKPLKVYVERLAARVDLESIGEIEGIEVVWGTEVYKIIFEPTGWGLEALEKTEYLAKHSGKKSDYTTGSTREYPSDFYDWSNYEGKRTFWAESITFGQKLTYPVFGKDDTNVSLDYNIFRLLTNNAEDFTKENYGSAEKKLGSAYLMEHTFKSSELTAAVNPYAVPTSFVLAGQYTKAEWVRTDQIPGDFEHTEGSSSGISSPTQGSDLSFNGGGFYIRLIDMERTPDETKGTLERRLYREKGGEDGEEDELLTAMIHEQYTIFKGVYNDKQFLIGYEPLKGEDAKLILEIVNSKTRYYNKAWINASNTYTLQLKSDWQKIWNDAGYSGIELFYGKAVEATTDVSGKKTWKGEYVSLQSATIADVNKKIQELLGYATFYYQGKAFFYSPIPHYTGNEYTYTDDNPYKGIFKTEKDTKTDEIKLSQKTGDFGIVRNHVYNITIDGINSLGYGIPGDDVIPLPEPVIDQEIYMFDLVLKILPWNIFEYTLDI